MRLFIALVALVILAFTTVIYVDIARQPASVINTTITKETTTAPKVEVARTRSGYEPSEVVIEQGTVVVFKNETDAYHWPASNDHPIHTLYPDFDPRRAIAPGETWSFQFSRPGTWRYHDHLRASVGGTIMVEDPNEEAFDQLEEGQVLEEVAQ